MSNRILFFGNERLATGVSTASPMLRALVAAGYEVAAVVVAQAEAGQSRQSRQLEIAAAAEENNIPVISPENINKAVDEIAAFDARAAVLVAYGKIVPPQVLDLFPRGIVNIHPSLLPRHRGPIPIESVILNGVTETGVSLMKLSPEMDAGPVYVQEAVQLNGSETKQDLADKLALLGKDMLLDKLPMILDGSLEPSEQNDSEATYDKPLEKRHSELDFSKPAEQLSREIRAYAGWPRSRTKIGSTDVIITSTQPGKGSGKPGEIKVEDKQLVISTSDGDLIIESLIPSGKKMMTSREFLAGYRIG